MKSMAHQFLDFARSKPADESYVYTSCVGCAFAQFLREHGYAKEPSTSRDGWHDRATERLRDQRPQPFPDDVLVDEPWTFGALASRLETALSSEGVER